MKHIFTPIYILLVFTTCFAQDKKFSDSIYYIQDSVIIPTKSGIEISAYDNYWQAMVPTPSGKEPAVETINHAGEPLIIKWFNESYIEVPIWENRVD